MESRTAVFVLVLHWFGLCIGFGPGIDVAVYHLDDGADPADMPRDSDNALLPALLDTEADDLAAAERPIVGDVNHLVAGFGYVNELPLDLNITGVGHRCCESPDMAAELQSPYFHTDRRVTTPQAAIVNQDDILQALYDDPPSVRAGDEDEAPSERDYEPDNEEASHAQVMVATRRGKRQRLSSSSSAHSTQGGLTVVQKMFCLAHLIANKDQTPRDLIARVQNRFPEAGDAAIRNYRANVFSWTAVCSELHRFLLGEADRFDTERSRIISEAKSIPDLSNEKVRGSAERWVLHWMEYCIRPLRTHEGAEQEICYEGVNRSWRMSAYLSDSQIQKYLIAELETLKESHGVSGGFLAELNFHSFPLIFTTISPPVPHTRMDASVEVQPRSTTKAQWGRVGISDDVKRACLQVMIDNPDITPEPGVTLVSSHFPGVDAKSANHYFANMARKPQVPWSIHHYLLERNATSFRPAMVKELMTLYPAELKSLRESVKEKVEMWVKYCILPLLPDRTKLGSLCEPDRRTNSAKPFMRLAFHQRRALFTDLLAELDKKSATRLETKCQTTYV